jgi:hypothetical protein
MGAILYRSNVISSKGGICAFVIHCECALVERTEDRLTAGNGVGHIDYSAF